MSAALVLARAWSCGDARAEERAAADPEAAQARVRAATMAGLRGTALGQTARTFDALAVRDAHDWAPLWSAQRAGQKAFARGPVRFVERTGGSRGARKEVPIVDGTLRAFARYARRHVGDVVRNLPGLTTGAAWVLTSPPARDAPTGGAPDDAAFLGRLSGLAWRAFTVDPLGGAPLEAGPAWLDAVALGLARQPTLEVLALWHPSLMLVLLDRLAALAEQLPIGQRAAARDGDTEALWPRLRLVVAWGDAFAAAPFQRLADRFPHAVAQRRGLLATEGPVSSPRLGVTDAIPLWDAAVLEIERADGGLVPLHALREGERGRLVASWPGGLVRTRLGDVVEAGAAFGAGPTLRLVGRAEGVVDLVGEKLDAAWVRDLLDDVLGATEAALEGTPAEDGPAGYTLWTSAPVGEEVRAEVERRLLAHAGFGSARALGQLAPLVARVDPELRTRALLAGATDQRWGELKGRAVWVRSQRKDRG